MHRMPSDTPPGPHDGAPSVWNAPPNTPQAALAPAFQDLAECAARPSLRDSRRQDLWSLAGCNLIVFVTSICIMVLELTASRLIAKSVGSSLYTWTSVIGVVLAGISV